MRRNPQLLQRAAIFAYLIASQIIQAAGNVQKAKCHMKITAIRSRKASCSVLIVAFTLIVSNLSAKDLLQIEQAYCGTAGAWRGVTAFLQSEIKDDRLLVNLAQPFDKIGGDPAPNRVKNLIIDYRFNGRPYRLLLEEQSQVAFTIDLPSPEALPPGHDPRASAIMADILPNLAPDVQSLSDYNRYLTYIAFYTSLAAIVCAATTLVQIRKIKSQLRQDRNDLSQDTERG